jgi:hypothetical protein
MNMEIRQVFMSTVTDMQKTFAWLACAKLRGTSRCNNDDCFGSVAKPLGVVITIVCFIQYS